MVMSSNSSTSTTVTARSNDVGVAWMKQSSASVRTPARAAFPHRRQTTFRSPRFLVCCCWTMVGCCFWCSSFFGMVVFVRAAPSSNVNQSNNDPSGGGDTSANSNSNSNNNPPPSTTPAPPVSSRAADAVNKILFSQDPDDGERQQQPESVFLRQYATLARRTQPVLGSLRAALFGRRRPATAAPAAEPPTDFSALWRALCSTLVHWQDLALLAALGWCTVPLLQLPYKVLTVGISSSSKDNNKDDDSLATAPPPVPYRQSLVYHLADHLQQVSQIAVAVYLVDIVKLLFLALGWNNSERFIARKYVVQLPHAFCQAAYAVWAANRGAALKRRLLRSYVSRHPETFGRARVVNRLADAAIYALAAAAVLGILQVHLGLALQSGLVAFGGVGTLAVGLATRGIAQEIVHGLMLASSDRIYEGDQVQFGNGEVSGTIVQLGWMETVLRRSDEVTVSVPNSHLLSQRVCNLSRVRRSQVKQVLRVRWEEDADRIVPDLIDSLRREIRSACPELITDGSRPFRVHWTAIHSGDTAPCCEITIDARFNIKPTGDVYLANQQNVLSAIHRALKENNVKLVQPQPPPPPPR